MATPLRSLFLAVGVKGDAAVANLARVEAQADLTTAAFIRLAESAVIAKKAMGLQSFSLGAKQARAEVAALRRELLATNSAMVTFAERGRHAAGGFGPGGRGGGRPGDPRFRGAIGVGTSVFIGTVVMGVGAAAFGQRAGLEREAMLASFAGGRARADLEESAIDRARRYHTTVLESARLMREVEQLGLKGMREQSNAVADAASSFHVLNSEIASEEAAAGIFRLIKATSKSTEQFNHNLLAAERYASALQIAGNNSAAGASQVFEMTKELQPLAQIMDLDAAEVITLASAFSDLNAEQKELFRGSLTRMATKGVIDPNNPLQSLMEIGQKMQSMTAGERLNFLESLGLSTVRDPVAMAAISAELVDISQTLPQVRHELEGLGAPKIRSQVQEVLKGLQGRFDGMRSSLSILGARLIETVTPALVALMEVLTALADVISKNKFLQILLAGAGVAVVGRMAGTLFGKMGLIGMGGGAAAGGLAGAAGMQTAARMNLAASLLAFVPGRGLVRGFRGMAAGSRAGAGAVRAAFGETGTFADIVLGAGKTGRSTAMQRFGGRFFGMFGARGVGLAEALAGRAALGGFAGRAAGAALGGGPIGIIIMALGLLEKPFSRLAGWFDKLAEKGGVVGAIFRGLSNGFKVLAIAGRLINIVFDAIGAGIKKLLGWLKPVGDFFGWIGGKVGNFLDTVGGWLGMDKGGGSSAAPPTAVGGNTVINNVQVGTPTGFEQFMASNAASSAAALHYSRRTSLGGP